MIYLTVSALIATAVSKMHDRLGLVLFAILLVLGDAQTASALNIQLFAPVGTDQNVLNAALEAEFIWETVLSDPVTINIEITVGASAKPARKYAYPTYS